MRNVMAALPNVGVQRRKVWLTPTRMSCTNAAKTRNPLKLAGVLQTTGSISAASGPKFTILWGHVEEILLLKIFFPIIDMCLSCEDMARQSAMVPRWRFFGEFLGPAFLASRAQHVSDLGPGSQTILGQTYDISYDNILWPIHRTLMINLGHKLR